MRPLNCIQMTNLQVVCSAECKAAYCSLACTYGQAPTPCVICLLGRLKCKIVQTILVNYQLSTVLWQKAREHDSPTVVIIPIDRHFCTECICWTD